MKIPFFEILALLFLLWPLIQKYMKKNQPEAGQPDGYQGQEYHEDENYTHQSDETPAKSEWDQAMRELEMIFTGQTPPKPQPVDTNQVQTSRPDNQVLKGVKHETDERSFYAQNLKKKAQQDSEFKSDELVKKLTASDNKIYKSLDEAVEIDDSDTPVYSIFQDVKDGTKLRDFIIMKEVLDKPRSRRPIGRNHF